MDLTQSERFWPLFFAVYEALPRQGPGSLASTARALALCAELPDRPEILDLGCGSGAQTLDLATLTQGQVTAVDLHPPFIHALQAAAGARNLSDSVHAVVGDMAAPPLPAGGQVDLIWSEGAAYFLGIANALTLWRCLLRPGGYLAYSEAVWLRPDAPAPVQEMWLREYPAISDVESNLRLPTAHGYEVCGHFVLPREDWWVDFYTPMTARIAALSETYGDDAEARAILAFLAEEIAMHRRYEEYYSYLFMVLRRT